MVVISVLVSEEPDEMRVSPLITAKSQVNLDLLSVAFTVVGVKLLDRKIGILSLLQYCQTVSIIIALARVPRRTHTSPPARL